MKAEYAQDDERADHQPERDRRRHRQTSRTRWPQRAESALPELDTSTAAVDRRQFVPRCSVKFCASRHRPGYSPRSTTNSTPHSEYASAINRRARTTPRSDQPLSKSSRGVVSAIASGNMIPPGNQPNAVSPAMNRGSSQRRRRAVCTSPSGMRSAVASAFQVRHTRRTTTTNTTIASG